MAAKSCGEQGSGPWDTAMKGKHCLLLGPHTMGNSSKGDWRTIKKEEFNADNQTMANAYYTQECSVKATTLDLRKTNPNKC